MKTIGNLIWFLLSGLWLGISYIVAGVVSCLTIIGIPFGIQSIKLASYVMWPFGRELVLHPGNRLARGILNVIWIILGGAWLAMFHVVLGVVLCLTIIGIPFGLKNLSMAKLALFPFGYTVVPKGLADPHSGPITNS